MAKQPLPISDRYERAGWTLKAPGWWHRGDEVIFRRSTGVWFWYPDGLGKRAIGPFMTMSGARKRAAHAPALSRDCRRRCSASTTPAIICCTRLYRKHGH